MTTTIKTAMFLRVSSKEQRDEGYSLEAQERTGREYAARHGLEIVRMWSVAETAKSDVLRKAFKEFIQFVRATPSIRVMLFEKPDRMTRNFTDLATVYDLIEKHGKEAHFFRSGLRINRESKSSDQMQLDFQVVIARNYILNLREEVKKGMRQKVLNGGFPAVAPLGYRNNRATAEIEQVPEQAPIIKKLFELYATGRYSLRELMLAAADLGLRYRNSTNTVQRCTMYTMLQNPAYYGMVRWGGEMAQGKHEPIITKALFDRVKAVLDRENRPRNMRFAFRGLAVCGACGSVVTAEQHTKRLSDGTQKAYVYYHCTGWKNSGRICAYIREEELIRQLGEHLKSLQFRRRDLALLVKALKKSSESEVQTAKERLATLIIEEKRLKNRLDQAYNDKLDGVISPDDYQEKASSWRDRLEAIRDESKRLEIGHIEIVDEAVRVLDLAQRAYALYMKQDDNFERRKLIEIFSSRVAISGDRVLSNWLEPFKTASKLAKEAG